jgi:hypothetical protein
MPKASVRTLEGDLVSVETVETVETAVSYDISNSALAAEGKKKIEWAERNMPVLAQIKEHACHLRDR